MRFRAGSAGRCSAVRPQVVCRLFASGKRETAYEARISDWSSDVCSSELLALSPRMRLLSLVSPEPVAEATLNPGIRISSRIDGPDRKSVVSGKSVSVRVDLGGRRIIQNENPNTRPEQRKDVT